TLVARQRLARSGSANSAAAAGFAPSSVDVSPSPDRRMTFENDADLTAVSYLDKDGRHWLDLMHTRLLPGTLLRIGFADADASSTSWSRYVVLAEGFPPPQALARVYVEQALPQDGRALQLRVDVMDSTVALSAREAAVLRESFAAACQDDRAAVSHW